MTHPIIEFALAYNEEVKNHNANILTSITGWIADINGDEMKLLSGINPLAVFVRDFYKMNTLIKWKRTIMEDLNELFNVCDDILNLPHDDKLHMFYQNENIYHAGHTLLRLMATYNFSTDRILSEQISRNILDIENHYYTDIEGAKDLGINKRYVDQMNDDSIILINKLRGFDYLQQLRNKNFGVQLINLISSTVFLNHRNEKVNKHEITSEILKNRFGSYIPTKDSDDYFRVHNSIKYFMAIDRADLAIELVALLDKLWEVPQGTIWKLYAAYFGPMSVENYNIMLGLVEVFCALHRKVSITNLIWQGEKTTYIRTNDHDYMVEDFKYNRFQ